MREQPKELEDLTAKVYGRLPREQEPRPSLASNIGRLSAGELARISEWNPWAVRQEECGKGKRVDLAGEEFV